MANIFNSIRVKKPKRNFFDLSRDAKLSLDMGRLVPVFLQECLPSDSFSMKAESLVRFAPLIAPMMHKVDVKVDFFFVPNRIIYPAWEDFITDTSDTAPLAPYVNIKPKKGSIADYMGLPVGKSTDFLNDLKVSALPFAALNKIYHDYYKDQNLQTNDFVPLTSGLNSNYGLFANDLPPYRAWKKDYFAGALPFAQKGDAVNIPLGDRADLEFEPNANAPTFVTKRDGSNPDGGPVSAGSYVAGQNSATATNGDPTQWLKYDITQHTYVDLSTATAVTINDLRNAFSLQKWLERNARSGTRYTENIYGNFGVRSKDQRLDRAEHIGSSSTPVMISEVLQTSSTDQESTPLATMGGHGISGGYSSRMNYFCEEHGYIIGLMSIIPKPAYQQGINKTWSRFDCLDYFWPDFANIGEQPILSKELFANGSPQDNDVFGYTPRYAEYRYAPTTVHGDFRDVLDYWHLGRKFANRPQLNLDFIRCVPSKRIFAVQEELPGEQFNSIYCHFYCDVKSVRPLPRYGIPNW